jgi:hypothetical protein
MSLEAGNRRKSLVTLAVTAGIRQICGISGKFSVPVRHFIAVPYIIDRIGISSY